MICQPNLFSFNLILSLVDLNPSGSRETGHKNPSRAHLQLRHRKTLLRHSSYSDDVLSLIRQYQKLEERVVLRAINIGTILDAFKTFITEKLGGRTENELWLEKSLRFRRMNFISLVVAASEEYTKYKGKQFY